MARKRNRRARIRCAAGAPKSARPHLPWPPAAADETAVVVVVVVVTVALAAVLVAAGMSAGVALELAGGGWLLAARLRRERA
ncbi:hypothetical protein [Streptomyces sp. NRRL S-350]|uniref:hypothetical protein n=1 Tax=Streptomyces sp. NRRL S-350 TaxID=1463902 RepID=UPI0004BEF461|nr:hypothetical protein [Streptomyces sp. NRRL S-350]